MSPYRTKAKQPERPIMNHWNEHNTQVVAVITVATVLIVSIAAGFSYSNYLESKNQNLSCKTACGFEKVKLVTATECQCFDD